MAEALNIVAYALGWIFLVSGGIVMLGVALAYLVEWYLAYFNLKRVVFDFYKDKLLKRRNRING